MTEILLFRRCSLSATLPEPNSAPDERRAPVKPLSRSDPRRSALAEGTGNAAWAARLQLSGEPVKDLPGWSNVAGAVAGGIFPPVASFEAVADVEAPDGAPPKKLSSRRGGWIGTAGGTGADPTTWLLILIGFRCSSLCFERNLKDNARMNPAALDLLSEAEVTDEVMEALEELTLCCDDSGAG